MLVGAGSNPNAVNNEQYSSLHYASRDGYLEVIKLLVGGGARLNGRNDIGNTPLLYACLNGHAPSVRFIHSSVVLFLLQIG